VCALGHARFQVGQVDPRGPVQPVVRCDRPGLGPQRVKEHRQRLGCHVGRNGLAGEDVGDEPNDMRGVFVLVGTPDLVEEVVQARHVRQQPAR
jgi:hypothetical protein